MKDESHLLKMQRRKGWKPCLNLPKGWTKKTSKGAYEKAIQYSGSRIKQVEGGQVWEDHKHIKMKDILAGFKKRLKEAHAVFDVQTKNLVVATEEIRKVP